MKKLWLILKEYMADGVRFTYQGLNRKLL